MKKNKDFCPTILKMNQEKRLKRIEYYIVEKAITDKITPAQYDNKMDKIKKIKKKT